MSEPTLERWVAVTDVALTVAGLALLFFGSFALGHQVARDTAVRIEAEQERRIDLYSSRWMTCQMDLEAARAMEEQKP